MILKELHIQNFRCFETIDIRFDDSLSVLVGVNASGKSSILNAASIAIGSFLLGIDGQSSKSITYDNVRHTTGRSGTLLELEPQYPSVVEAKGILCGEQIAWMRSVNTSSGHNTTKDAKSISNAAFDMQQKIRNGNSEVILPVLAFYGTDRVANKTNLTESTRPKRFSRFSGYTNCLDPRSSERHLLDWMRKLTFSETQSQDVAPELTAIKKAVLAAYNSADEHNHDFVAIDFRYNLADERLEFVLENCQEERQLEPYEEMSDGYRSVLGLVADIARRMGALNPQLAKTDTILAAPGVVLIDEIDQHLHPAWQQHIIKDLRTTFPNIQFIATTHSPSIINSISDENLIVLGRNGIQESPIQTYGRDANSILEDVMGALPRPQEITDAFEVLYDLIDKGKLLDAKKELDDIERKVGELDPDVTKARVFLELEMVD